MSLELLKRFIPMPKLIIKKNKRKAMWSVIKDQTENSISEKYGDNLQLKENGSVVTDPSQVQCCFTLLRKTKFVK